MNEDLGSARAGSLLSVHWVVRTAQHMLQESIFVLMKYQMAIGISQHSSTAGMSCLVSLATFSMGAAGSGDEHSNGYCSISSLKCLLMWSPTGVSFES